MGLTNVAKPSKNPLKINRSNLLLLRPRTKTIIDDKNIKVNNVSVNKVVE